MFTSFDKALAAFVISGVSLANQFGLTDVTPETANTISVAIAALAPFIVYFVPNKKRT